MMKKIVLFLILFSLVSMAGCATVTPLGRAAKSGDIKEVESLLSQGANVNEIVTPGLAPLHEAVFNNAPLDIVRLMIDKGADLNMKSCGDGWANTCNCGTPLHITACKGNVNMMKLLIEKGAEIDVPDRWGGTPLVSAAQAGQTAAIRLLIEKGADTDNAKAFLLSKRQDNAARVIEMAERSARKGAAQTAATKEPLSAPAPLKSDVDELPSVKKKPNPNAYAVVIGIETYRQKLPKADFAVADAATVKQCLTRMLGYPEENIIALSNEHATYTDLVKYIEEWLPKNMEPGGSVFFYYSGHGAPNPKTGDVFLVPYDGDPNFIEKTGYPLKKLYEQLSKLPAKEIMVALDSCFSGAGGKSVLAEGSRPLVMNMQTAFTPAKNMVVLTASSDSEISSTYKDKGHGLFTYFLLKGVKGEADLNEDGKIEVEELYSYLKPQVQKTARKLYNNEQSPQLIAPNREIIIR
ncbi:MAG: ankyrin repeat domain-containing protein [Desulfobacterales bacterium]|nr:ankyrin repeat domain-containing protein [Desulfobacterales bacterium]